MTSCVVGGKATVPSKSAGRDGIGGDGATNIGEAEAGAGYPVAPEAEPGAPWPPPGTGGEEVKGDGAGEWVNGTGTGKGEEVVPVVGPVPGLVPETEKGLPQLGQTLDGVGKMIL